MLVVLFGMIYYGWPILETILIALPLPDPKNIKEKSLDYLNYAWSYL